LKSKKNILEESKLVVFKPNTSSRSSKRNPRYFKGYYWEKEAVKLFYSKYRDWIIYYIKSPCQNESLALKGGDE